MTKHISALSSSPSEDKKIGLQVHSSLPISAPTPHFKPNATLNEMYSSYKHSPHSPSSLLLKYAIHRSENADAYSAAKPQQQKMMDQAFLSHHQQGSAAKKIGHITTDSLSAGLAQNPHIVPQLLAHQRSLHDTILQNAPKAVDQLNGTPHLRLARNMNIPQEKRGDDHALYSMADKTQGQFGQHEHHQHVPLKNVWFSYELGHPDTDPAGHGHEDEFVVSPHKNVPRDNTKFPTTDIINSDFGAPHAHGAAAAPYMAKHKDYKPAELNSMMNHPKWGVKKMLLSHPGADETTVQMGLRDPDRNVSKWAGEMAKRKGIINKSEDLEKGQNSDWQKEEKKPSQEYWYHGSSKYFKHDEMKPSTGGFLNEGYYLTNHHDRAKYYSLNEEKYPQHVYQYEIHGDPNNIDQFHSIYPNESTGLGGTDYLVNKFGYKDHHALHADMRAAGGENSWLKNKGYIGKRNKNEIVIFDKKHMKRIGYEKPTTVNINSHINNKAAVKAKDKDWPTEKDMSARIKTRGLDINRPDEPGVVKKSEQRQIAIEAMANLGWPKPSEELFKSAEKNQPKNKKYKPVTVCLSFQDIYDFIVDSLESSNTKELTDKIKKLQHIKIDIESFISEHAGDFLGFAGSDFLFTLPPSEKSELYDFMGKLETKYKISVVAGIGQDLEQAVLAVMSNSKHNRKVTETMAKAEDNFKVLDLVHFSRHPDLQSLDPSFQFTGQAGKEKTRIQQSREYLNHAVPGFKPANYLHTYGSNGEDAEPMFNNMSRYHIQVKDKDIYDLSKDPDKVFAKVKDKYKEHYGPSEHALNHPDLVHNELKSMGYKGWKASGHESPTFANSVMLYDKIPVKNQHTSDLSAVKMLPSGKSTKI